MPSNILDLVRQFQSEALGLRHHRIHHRQQPQGSPQKNQAYLGDVVFAQPENMKKSSSALCPRMWT